MIELRWLERDAVVMEFEGSIATEKEIVLQFRQIEKITYSRWLGKQQNTWSEWQDVPTTKEDKT